MSRKKILILAAGGQGPRPEVLLRSLERFLSACPGISVVTVLPKESFGPWKDYCSARNFHYPQILVPGGITRFHSVRAALEKVPDGALVAVHDGVRPLVSEAMIRRLFGMMDTARAVVPVLSETDSLMVLDREGGTLAPAPERLDRNRVYRTQTPQIFRSEDLRAAYRQPYDVLFTDDASVARGIKIPLTFTEGERFNIKITTREELQLADAILRSCS